MQQETAHATTTYKFGSFGNSNFGKKHKTVARIKHESKWLDEIID